MCIKAAVGVYKGCHNCNAKVIGTNGAVGVCTKCNTKMKIVSCTTQSVANVILKDGDGKEHQATILNDVL